MSILVTKCLLFDIVCDTIQKGCYVSDTIAKGVSIIYRLARLRKIKGFSQEKLSKVSGVSRVTIARIETGKTSPNLKTLELIANALKVPVTDIVEGG